MVTVDTGEGQGAYLHGIIRVLNVVQVAGGVIVLVPPIHSTGDSGGHVVGIAIAGYQQNNPENSPPTPRSQSICVASEALDVIREVGLTCDGQTLVLFCQRPG